MKNLAIDIGNVIVHCDFDKLLNALSKTLNISKDDAWSFLNRTQKLHDVGLTNLRDELAYCFDIKSEVILDDLLDCWDATIWEERQVLNMIEELQEAGVKIALLSNIGFEHVSYLDELLMTSPAYTRSIHFFSCEVGVRKPASLYYQTFLSRYTNFKDCLYVDDVQANLDAAKLFGLKTVRFALDDFVRDGVLDSNDLKRRLKELKKLILER